MSLFDEAKAILNVTSDVPRTSRRELLKIAVGAGAGMGYALAAGPAMAQTAIKTSSKGLDVGEAMIDVGGYKLPAYYAKPQEGKILPVILVVSEIFGVHEYIADTCRRFAKEGYLALAPELLLRQGDPAMYAEVAKLISEVINKVPDAQVMADLDATLEWASKNGGDAGRVGVTGFCWGGRITWLFSAHAKIQAGVAWYGRLVGQATPLQPKHPIDIVGGLHAPVLGLYAGQDTGIPLESVEKMKTALQSSSSSDAAKKSEFVIYPDAPHAFHADYRPSYRQEAAEDGWKRCLAWFKAHGVA